MNEMIKFYDEDKIDLKVYKLTKPMSIKKALEWAEETMMPKNYDAEASLYFYLGNKGYNHELKPMITFGPDYGTSKITRRNSVDYFIICDFGDTDGDHPIHYYFCNTYGFNCYKRSFVDTDPELYNVNIYNI